jgi:hypothetical protein
MNPIRAWNAFWFRPISARPLGAFRLLIGIMVLAHLALLSFDLDHWLTDRGLLVGDEAREIAGPLRPSPLQWVQDPVSVRVFVGATAVVATVFTVGWRTRIMGVLLYLGLLSIHHRNIPTNCGPDELLLIMVFYLMLAPAGAAYSLDARRIARRRGPSAEPLIVPWAQRLIQLHLCLIYLDTAILKCNGSTWLGGTAIHYTLHNPELGRFDLSALAPYPILINILTYGALFLEFALAFLLWFRATRPFIALAGLALHAGVLIVVNVPLFGELMTATYLTFFTVGELDGLLHFLSPWRWRERTEETAPVAHARVDPPHAAAGPHGSISSHVVNRFAESVGGEA